MESLRIVTSDWKIVNYDEFIFVGVVRNVNEENPENSVYILAGILDEEMNFVALYIDKDDAKVMEAFEDVVDALDGKKPLLDLREPEEANLITMISRGQQRPGSELN